MQIVRRVFPQYDRAVVIRKNLKRVSFVDAHRTAQLLWDDDTPQIVDLSDDACRFQINNTSLLVLI
jgi:hypothetical protein